MILIYTSILQNARTSALIQDSLHSFTTTLSMYHGFQATLQYRTSHVVKVKVPNGTSNTSILVKFPLANQRCVCCFRPWKRRHVQWCFFSSSGQLLLGVPRVEGNQACDCSRRMVALGEWNHPRKLLLYPVAWFYLHNLILPAISKYWKTKTCCGKFPR